MSRAESLYKLGGDAKPVDPRTPYTIVKSNARGTFVVSEDRWEALIAPHGELVNFTHDVVGIDFKTELSGEPLTPEERREACRAAYRAAGGQYDLWFQDEVPDSGEGETISLWQVNGFLAPKGIVHLDRSATFLVGSRTGRVLRMLTGTVEQPPYPAPLANGPTPQIGLGSAKGALAALVFGWGKDPAKSRRNYPSTHGLEDLFEPRLAAWIPAPLPADSPARYRSFQNLSPDDLDLARRGAAHLVWWIRLKTLRDEGDPLDAAYVFAKVDAHDGRVLDVESVSVYDGFGASPPPKPSPAPVLTGPAQLTANGRTRAVRLVPVAARPFAATGRAVLVLPKRIVEVEVDAKAGLVRYRSKLARAL